MGVRFPSVFSTTILNSPVVTTAETIVVTAPPFSPPIDSASVLIYAVVQDGGAASTTSTTLRLYRGTTTGGTLVGGAMAQPWAAGAKFMTVYWVDQPPIVAGQQYSVSFQNAAATGNATIQSVLLSVFAL